MSKLAAMIEEAAFFMDEDLPVPEECMVKFNAYLIALDASHRQLLEALSDGRNDLVMAASFWNQDEDRQVADFHRERCLELVKRVDSAIATAKELT